MIFRGRNKIVKITGIPCKVEKDSSPTGMNFPRLFKDKNLYKKAKYFFCLPGFYNPEGFDLVLLLHQSLTGFNIINRLVLQSSMRFH